MGFIALPFAAGGAARPLPYRVDALQCAVAMALCAWRSGPALSDLPVGAHLIDHQLQHLWDALKTGRNRLDWLEPVGPLVVACVPALLSSAHLQAARVEP